MAAKQEVTAEEGLTVKTQARAPSAGVVLQNPPPPPPSRSDSCHSTWTSPWSWRWTVGPGSMKFLYEWRVQNIRSRYPWSLLWSVALPVHQVLKPTPSTPWVQQQIHPISWQSVNVQRRWWLLGLSVGVGIRVDRFEERDMKRWRDAVVSRKLKLICDLIYLF